MAGSSALSAALGLGAGAALDQVGFEFVEPGEHPGLTCSIG
ncbi:hypothetical protein [Nonomuraea sp. NPDC049784]